MLKRKWERMKWKERGKNMRKRRMECLEVIFVRTHHPSNILSILLLRFIPPASLLSSLIIYSLSPLTVILQINNRILSPSFSFSPSLLVSVLSLSLFSFSSLSLFSFSSLSLSLCCYNLCQTLFREQELIVKEKNERRFEISGK